MWVSSIYICPVRGLAGLEPPEPGVLGRTAKVARGLGSNRLVIPVLEEALLKVNRHRVRYFDGLIRCLDQSEDAGVSIQIMAPAQRIMGMDWVAPYLVRGSLEERAAPVFVDGAMRTLRPYAWWADPSIVHKRLECFRELVAALCGHPALVGWIVMDRVLEWSRPEFQTADLILKAYCAEIRGRDEGGRIDLSIGVTEFLDPTLTQKLAGEVDGLYLRGIESGTIGWMRPQDLTEEMSLAAYLHSMARWLFQRPVALEIGWGMTKTGIREETLATASVLRQQDTAGVTWLNLVDPAGHLLFQPPWSLRVGLERAGLLDQRGDPKEGVETLFTEMGSGDRERRVTDVIDIDEAAYEADPEPHLRRLWDHFREATQ